MKANQLITDSGLRTLISSFNIDTEGQPLIILGRPDPDIS
jgi:hypothetical protein